MRTVCIPGVAGDIPQLGAGCASLGSRISAKQGAAALDALYTRGVRWFDVAPSYGDGAAEVLLGEFLKRQAGGTFICTKVGFVPTRTGAVKRLIKPLARAAVGLAPGTRKLMRRRGSAERLRLTGERVTFSLETSLRRLRRDYVDVLALHEPEPEDALRDDVLQALEQAKRAGHVRALALASYPAEAAAIAGQSGVFDIIQIPNNALEPGVPIVQPILSNAPRGLITHSAYGGAQSIMRIVRALARTELFRNAAEDLGYGGAPKSMAAEMLADYAFNTNPSGVILMSMFQLAHIEANTARAAKGRREDIVDLFDRYRTQICTDES